MEKFLQPGAGSVVFIQGKEETWKCENPGQNRLLQRETSL